MDIYRTTDPRDISDILVIDDERLEEQIPCSKGEWIQWLMQYIENKDMLGVWVAKEDRVIAYVVAFNAVQLPISNSIFIFYSSFYSLLTEDENMAVVDMIKIWAVEKGAKKIAIQTKYPRIMSRYGFKEDEGKPMILEL